MGWPSLRDFAQDTGDFLTFPCGQPWKTGKENLSRVMHCAVVIVNSPETEILTEVCKNSLQTLNLIRYSYKTKKIPSWFLMLLRSAGQSWLQTEGQTQIMYSYINLQVSEILPVISVCFSLMWVYAFIIH